MKDSTLDPDRFSAAWLDHIRQLNNLYWSLENKVDRDNLSQYINGLQNLVQTATNSLIDNPRSN